MFPGINLKSINKAAKLRILEKIKPEFKKPEEPLAMGIKPMDKRGDINVDFN